MNFIVEDLHVILLSNLEFNENRYMEKPYITAIGKLNGALFSTDLDKIQ